MRPRVLVATPSSQQFFHAQTTAHALPRKSILALEEIIGERVQRLPLFAEDRQ